MRHCERGPSYRFFSPLTMKGKLDAQNGVVEQCCKLQINKVICSPYPRCVESISPYCEKAGISIELNWKLAESTPDSMSLNMIDNYPFCKAQLEYSNQYIPITGTPFAKEVIRQQIKTIIAKYKDSPDNILLVCHQPVINALANRASSINVECGKIFLVEEKMAKKCSSDKLIKNISQELQVEC